MFCKVGARSFTAFRMTKTEQVVGNVLQDGGEILRVAQDDNEWDKWFGETAR
jgi:hypothetical protein